MAAIPTEVPDLKPLPTAPTQGDTDPRKVDAGGVKETSGHGVSPESPDSSRRSQRSPHLPIHNSPTADLRSGLSPYP